MAVWQFVLPVTICVVAYVKILLVLRRQGRVNPTQRRTTTVATKETAVGPSKGATQTTGKGTSTSATTERDNSASDERSSGLLRGHSSGERKLRSSFELQHLDCVT